MRLTCCTCKCFVPRRVYSISKSHWQRAFRFCQYVSKCIIWSDPLIEEKRPNGQCCRLSNQQSSYQFVIIILGYQYELVAVPHIREWFYDVHSENLQLSNGRKYSWGDVNVICSVDSDKLAKITQSGVFFICYMLPVISSVHIVVYWSPTQNYHVLCTVQLCSRRACNHMGAFCWTTPPMGAFCIRNPFLWNYLLIQVLFWRGLSTRWVFHLVIYKVVYNDLSCVLLC